MKSIVAALLADLRQHPAFPELLKAIPEPQLPRFKISEAERSETARAKWIFESGRRTHYDEIMFLLTGQSKKETE